MDYYYQTTNYWAVRWYRYRGYLLCAHLWFDAEGKEFPQYFTYLDHEMVDDHEEDYIKELIDLHIAVGLI
jgi:hypothetical protein